MLRERVFKNKRTRIGRILPAAVAAIVAVTGLGSCAALEMLDSLAAEEESTVQTAPEKPSGSKKPGGNTNDSVQTSAADPAPQGEAKTDSSSTDENNDTPAVTESPMNMLIGQIESVIEETPAPDSTPVAEGSVPDTVLRPDAGTVAPSDSTGAGSLLTDIADSGTSAGVEDIYTPGGFTPDDSMSTGSDLTSPAAAGLPVYLAYSELVDKYASYTAKDPAYKPEFCRYYITDIDDNGVPEMLIETGTIETDRTIYVYTFDGANAQMLGNFVAWHTRLGDGDGVIYTRLTTQAVAQRAKR